MPEMEMEEDLTLSKVTSGDRPALYVLGMLGAQSLKAARMAVFMVDALGRVHIMPPSAIKVLTTPKVDDQALNSLSDDQAIQALVDQGEPEEEILAYLKRRAGVADVG